MGRWKHPWVFWSLFFLLSRILIFLWSEVWWRGLPQKSAFLAKDLSHHDLFQNEFTLNQCSSVEPIEKYNLSHYIRGLYPKKAVWSIAFDPLGWFLLPAALSSQDPWSTFWLNDANSTCCVDEIKTKKMRIVNHSFSSPKFSAWTKDMELYEASMGGRFWKPWDAGIMWNLY